MFKIAGIPMALQMCACAAMAETNGPRFEESGKFAGTYLCVEQAAGGVRWDETSKEWKGTSFKVSVDKPVIFKIKAAGRKEWEAFGFDVSAMLYLAVAQIPEKGDGVSCWGERVGYHPADLVGYGHVIMSPEGKFRCEAYGYRSTYEVDLGTLRYIETYHEGFLDGKDMGGDTPSITVGKCTRID